MAERRPRDLTGKPLGQFKCSHCLKGDCVNCTDILREVFGLVSICHCTKPEHSGEPVTQQIKDPETGTVYAPGLSVSEAGGVVRECRSDG